LSCSPGVVIARQGHPQVSGSIELETYLALDHVIVSSRPSGLGPEDIALSREGKTRRIAVRCQQINTAMRIVSQSDLVLTMAASFAERANVWFDNQMLASPFAAPEIDTYLYWHSNCDADQANIWFRGMIEQAMAENTSPPL
jgi:DNA-binding transcriptional LysR family regulator